MQQFISDPARGVPFLGVHSMAKLINTVGLTTIFSDLVKRLENDFLRWDEFDKSPRYASHSSQGVIELMPVSDNDLFACKYVNGHPINTSVGLQTVAAFGVLSDVATGYPVLLTEMCLLTALRTAATSAMVARHAAVTGASTLALIGNGAQSEFQALAMQTIVGISAVRLFDIDQNASVKTATNLAHSGLDVIICDSVEEAVDGADIVTTCTADKRNATVLLQEHVKPGMFINAIGGDCPGKTELDGQILVKADRVLVEFEPQTRIEGEIQQLASDFPVTEFHRVLKGEQKARDNAGQLIVFDGVGFASEDFTALVYLRDLLKQQKTEHLALIAQPADPKNLFGLLNS